MKARYALFATLLLLPLVAACGNGDYRPEAIGEEGVVTVVMDSSQWAGPVGEAVRGAIGAYIGTLPAPEPAFELRQVSLRSQNDLDGVMRLKNVVFVAALSDSTNEARFLRSRLGEGAEATIREQGGAVIAKDDLWRQAQQVVYVTAPDTSALRETLAQQAGQIRAVLNTKTRTRLTRDMFDRGRQQDLEARLLEEHGFAVSVQHDYQVAIDTTRFVWLRRVLPDTWRSLFVYYEENADPRKLTPEWIYATRDSLAARYILGNLGDHAAIDYRRPLETENVNFLGRYAFETRGLWYMVSIDAEGNRVQQNAMGGPFLTYAFYDQESGRLYLIDGMVFAPGYEKREFLRQMEVIAHTFRTQAEAAPRPQQAAATR